MRTFVAFVICALLTVPTSASGSGVTLLRQAARLSGLKARAPVRTVDEGRTRFDADVVRTLDREYPRTLQRLDETFYMGLGLLPAERSIRRDLIAAARSANAQYDPLVRVLRRRTRPMPRRTELLHELVRALVDQNVGLRRLRGLRARNRDAALAAGAVVDGIAALASNRRAPIVRGRPLDRFLSLELTAGSGPGRALIAHLRYLGGRSAVLTALRTLPQTTEQLLHVDKFLQREPALPITLVPQVDDRALSKSETLRASETFGELDVRALLRAFSLPGAVAAAAGWAGGRLALYAGADGVPTLALVVRWDTSDDAETWRALTPAYVAAAFPGAQERVCPAVDHCWVSGDREIASARVGELTVFASGPAGELVAATLAR